MSGSSHNAGPRHALPADTHAVFLGAPGAGKGTQAQRLAAESGAEHVSTGDMLRQHVGRGTALGARAKAFMDDGRLVPDDVIIGMVLERIGEERIGRPAAEGAGANGAWILDGFPRTLPQAQALDSALAGRGARLSHVIWFAVPTEALVARTTGRRTCSKCGAIWHVLFKPTRIEGKCDVCAGELTQRTDDRPEAVTKRLSVYAQQTEPLLSYYRDQGVLIEIDAAQSPEQVFEELQRALTGVPRGNHP